MLPSLESLRCFTAAAKLLNFRAAARSVALTPAAFGQRIKQLEGQLGTPLFHRTTRSVQLTPAGLALRPLAEQCLLVATECVRVGANDKRPTLSPMDVVMGTRHELGMSWVLPQIPAIEEAHPWLRLHLHFGSGTELLLHVLSMAIDCAITSSRILDPRLDALRLHREDYVFVGSTKRLASTPLRRPDHANHHTLLDLDLGLPLFRYFRDAPDGGDHLRFGSLRRLGTIDALRVSILDGQGVGVLPEYLVRQDLHQGTMKRIFPKVTLLSDYFRIVFRGDDPRRALYEQLAQHMAKVPLR